MKPIAAIIAAIASLSCCLLFMISAEGEGEGEGKGKIVFSADLERPEPDIYSIDIDGRNLKNLTNHPASDSHPAPSPNGKFIAFLSWRIGGGFKRPSIFIMDDDGKNLRLFINEVAGRPAWSPDSKWVAFEKESKIVAMNINSGELKEIFEPRIGILTSWFGFAWSPDGKKIAFRLLGVGANKRGDIYTIDIDGTNLQQLTKNDPEDDADPAWSPDGKQIAFWSSKDGGGIFIMDSDGANVKLVHRNGGFPSWSANGQKIVFSSMGGIFVMNSDGSSLKEIFNPFKEKQRSAGMPSWLEQRFFNVESESKWKTSWGKVKRNF